ncbi:hypothetical protein H0H87_008075 [Tephrocybe sp. NHM501043]|nr:hypothetical protein H0H87_008075 [Tephrocybe sp. NHM501043]
MSLKAIPTRRLGKDGPIVSAIGLGTMGMGAFYGKTDDKESMDALTYAADRGMTFWDTAYIYGTCENLIGKWFTATGRRSEIFLATKFGAQEQGPTNFIPNSKPSYIKKALMRSLENLKTDYIDLYYQHIVDPEVPIEIVLEALRPFVEEGKIKWIGLSECSIDVLKRAKAVKGVGEKVIAAQMEYSPFELYLEKTGFVAAARETGISVVPYAPLGRGLVTGRHAYFLHSVVIVYQPLLSRFKSPADFPDDDYRKSLPRFSEENFPKNLEIVNKLQNFATKYNATTSQITLAWILAEHPDFVPIPGIRRVARVEENACGAEIVLEPEDVKAIRAVIDSAEVGGERYPIEYMPKGDCIPLSGWKGEK